MKVNIYETVEITDEQRVKLGAVLDGKVKPKRQATRDEIKGFVWTHGQDWETALSDAWREEFDKPEGTDAEPADEPEEDLLGTVDGDPEDLEDLI